MAQGKKFVNHLPKKANQLPNLYTNCHTRTLCQNLAMANNLAMTWQTPLAPFWSQAIALVCNPDWLASSYILPLWAIVTVIWLPLMAAAHWLWQLVVPLHSSGGQSPGRTAPMVCCTAGIFGIWDRGFVQVQKGLATLGGALLDPPLVIFMAHGPQQDGQIYHWWWSWLEPPGGSAMLVEVQGAFIGSHGFSTWCCVGTTWLVLETAATKKQIVELSFYSSWMVWKKTIGLQCCNKWPHARQSYFDLP